MQREGEPMETGKIDDIFSHFGISVEAMKQQVKQGEVEKIDFRICEKKNAKEATANMSGFGMEESQRIIIDYDKECELVLVRREVRKYGSGAVKIHLCEDEESAIQISRERIRSLEDSDRKNEPEQVSETQRNIMKLENMTKGQLVRIHETLNRWEWSYVLGNKPEDWDEMPNYRKPYMDNDVKTKEDIIRPYMAVIKKKIPYDI